MIEIVKSIGIGLGYVSGLISLYLFLVNRRLRTFKIDEELEQCQIKMDEVGLLIRQEQADKMSECTDGHKLQWIETQMEKKKNIEIAKIEIRMKHLNRLKRFRWLWSKVD